MSNPWEYCHWIVFFHKNPVFSSDQAEPWVKQRILSAPLALLCYKALWRVLGMWMKNTQSCPFEKLTVWERRPTFMYIVIVKFAECSTVVNAHPAHTLQQALL